MKTFEEWWNNHRHKKYLGYRPDYESAYEAGQRSCLPELSEEEWITLMPILTRLTKPKINDILILSKLINNALEMKERMK